MVPMPSLSSRMPSSCLLIPSYQTKTFPFLQHSPHSAGDQHELSLQAPLLTGHGSRNPGPGDSEAARGLREEG